MKCYRITIETENLVPTGIVSAPSQNRAWHLFKMAFYDQNPAHKEEISNADPMFCELGESDEIKVHEITTRL